MKKDIYILGIESSCDETSAAVVKNSRECLSNVIASQIEIHRRFGGVVPEIAGRNHLLAVMPVVDEALAKAGIGMKDLDAVAVTYGAGLIGCLLVGVSAAKAIAYALGIPLIAVNHIQGHIAANFIAFPDLQPPLLSLVASGGHTSIIAVEDYNTYKSISVMTCTREKICFCFVFLLEYMLSSYLQNIFNINIITNTAPKVWVTACESIKKAPSSFMPLGAG